MRPADDQGDRTPTVAIAGNGNAFVGWVQADGANPPNYFDSIWVRQYTAGAGAGWNAAGLFEGYVDYNAYDVNIATNTNGDAIVTYIQVSNSNPRTVQLWARRYSVTTNSFATNPSKVFEAGTIDAVRAAVGRARRRRQRHRGVRRRDVDRLSGPDQPDIADRSELAGGPDRDGDRQRREGATIRTARIAT